MFGDFGEIRKENTYGKGEGVKGVLDDIEPIQSVFHLCFICG